MESKEVITVFEELTASLENLHKICYKTREEAEVAARVAEYDHGAPKLTVYKCEFGDHWHLSSI